MAVISTNLEILEDETTRTGFKVYTRKDIDNIQELQTLSEEHLVLCTFLSQKIENFTTTINFLLKRPGIM